MKFNETKSKCIALGKDTEIRKNVYMDGVPLKWYTQVQHLGNVISSDLKDKCDIFLKRGCFYSNVNKVVAMFGFLQCNIKHKLFNTYCTSFYGSPVWDFTGNFVKDMCVAWNKAVRRIWNLPVRTHTSLLAYITDQLYILQQLELRYVKMFVCMLNSPNCTVASIAKRSMLSTHGAMGRNNVYLCAKYNLSMWSLNPKQVHLAITTSEKQDEARRTGQVIKELCLVRDGFYQMENQQLMDTVVTSIETLCTQ